MLTAKASGVATRLLFAAVHQTMAAVLACGALACISAWPLLKLKQHRAHQRTQQARGIVQEVLAQLVAQRWEQPRIVFRKDDGQKKAALFQEWLFGQGHDVARKLDMLACSARELLEQDAANTVDAQQQQLMRATVQMLLAAAQRANGRPAEALKALHPAVLRLPKERGEWQWEWLRRVIHLQRAMCFGQLGYMSPAEADLQAAQAPIPPRRIELRMSARSCASGDSPQKVRA